MEQKDITKRIEPYKECIVTRGSELCNSLKRGDISFKSRFILHQVQHFYLNSILDYDKTLLDSLTDDQLRLVMTKMNRNCPHIMIPSESALIGSRLPIKIGRWNVGDNSYVT